MSLRAKVLTVSDGVIAGTRDDKSGAALVERLSAAGYEVVDRRAVADGVDSVAGAVLDREAPGLAEAMRLVSPKGRLSRGLAGTAGRALVLNAPGSHAGAVECLEAVLDVLPHALALLAEEPTEH